MRSPRSGLSGDARLLVAGQGVRAAGYGFTAVLLGALLAARGYGSLQVGVADALIAGTALASLVVGAFSDRFGRRRSYALFFGGIAVAGVVVAAGAPLWVLLVVALTGTLSTDVVDNGPATPWNRPCSPPKMRARPGCTGGTTWPAQPRAHSDRWP